MGKKIDLTDRRFGRLVVREEAGRCKDGAVLWSCLCDCGKETDVRSKHLRNGNTKSCGCFLIETNTIHGFTNTKTFRVLSGMKTRCYNKNNRSYKYYGNQGIEICSEWLNDAGAFCQWALANGYREGLQIDRINNNGNYDPENCRFVTCVINNRNRKTSKMLEHDGIKLCLAEWAEKANLRYTTLWNRLNAGWSIEKALTKPTRKKRRLS